jgi:hypothetical protein
METKFITMFSTAWAVDNCALHTSLARLYLRRLRSLIQSSLADRWEIRTGSVKCRRHHVTAATVPAISVDRRRYTDTYASTTSVTKCSRRSLLQETFYLNEPSTLAIVATAVLVNSFSEHAYISCSHILSCNGFIVTTNYNSRNISNWKYLDREQSHEKKIRLPRTPLKAMKENIRFITTVYTNIRQQYHISDVQNSWSELFETQKINCSN